jgi:hypothetical protein
MANAPRLLGKTKHNIAKLGGHLILVSNPSLGAAAVSDLFK